MQEFLYAYRTFIFFSRVLNCNVTFFEDENYPKQNPKRYLVFLFVIDHENKQD